jgi:SAM-dependent methyltransferase
MCVLRDAEGAGGNNCERWHYGGRLHADSIKASLAGYQGAAPLAREGLNASRMDLTRARRFWDERADEDAFYFIDNRLEYGRPDIERFWRSGEIDLERFLVALLAQIDQPDDVVEIGCGIGRMTRVLSRDAASVRALDISARMLQRAQHHNGELANVEWIHGDGSTLAGIDDESADVVVSHVVFQHIADPAVTLGYVREIGRVLRPGGWAGFQISNDPSVHRSNRRFGDSARTLFRRAPRGQGHPDWLGSCVDLDDLRAVSEQAGMDVERVVGAGTQLCLVRTRKRSG